MQRQPLIPMTALTLALLLTAAPAQADTYKVDAVHTSVAFQIRHLLTKTSGKFAEFEGTIEIDPQARDTLEVTGSIETASIDTGDEERDEHLRGEDFFNVEKYPKITFKAGELTDVNDDRTKGKLSGSLSMHGVTKPIVLDVEWFGTTTDPWGNKKAGFAGTTTVNRKDYGIIWNKALDSGGFVIGNEVEIEINVEANLAE